MCTNVTYHYDSSKTVGEKIVGDIVVLQSQNLNFPRGQKKPNSDQVKLDLRLQEIYFITENSFYPYTTTFHTIQVTVVFSN